MSAEQDLANANVQIANLIAEVTRFRDAAMGINNIWPTITEGRNNTADGKYFSVPGDGAYLKLYRRAGTSQTLIAEFPDRAQVQSLIDTLGGRGVVGGSGDLMAVGAFGLGSNSAPILQDADNNEMQIGLYTIRSGVTVGGSPIANGFLFNNKYTSGRVCHIYVDESVNPRAFLRTYNSGAGGWGQSFQFYTTRNTTVDSNGFIKAASPIFRIANSAESATDESHNFTAAGAGAANSQAQGVTASHNGVGFYTVAGSVGFAANGWTVEIPQDSNGNRLCVVETEQADDGTITVRTFSKKVDSATGDVVADQPMDIPEGRWIDLRLRMPEPPTNDHPDDAPEPPAPLTPEEQEQQRIEQLERWRASASITPRQARLVLAKHGLLTGVTDAIAAIEDEQQRQVAEIEWEYATTIERAAPWVNDLYGSLGLTPEGVDELFREAALL
ncbi:hypothetical protein [Vreelandella aquamarina]|uniref:Phage tail protein C-terminal domain-containing protein n=1 Tax=Vreelandella aquamarina TaxID=77097 RepID=A0A857GLC5_9GAMM|nr:hypothetical protein [Halomonas meridiana]QHD50069.1 hypothetical protein CTT34_10395 [Halomonas meridiana]